ncbi:hypothetical protein [Edaphobacter bradus]|uniref:hypothetical protein n=1 Tax=Edaphobacter bradus TaxID=2259016 RepID=UPI0021DFAA46|nr:hypothetical protein [Edaphobacter bradus]
MKIAPGQQVSGALKLSSESGAKVRIRAEVDDFYIDATDTPQFERDIPHEAAYSCKNWLSLNPMEIELDKGGSLLVRYTIRVPTDTPEGSYNCAAGFTTLRPADETAAQGMGMHMEVRIVTAFYIQVGAPPILGSLKEITLEAIPPSAPAEGPPAQAIKDTNDPKGSWQAVVVLENSGRMYFRPTGKLDVVDAEGKTVETADFPSMAVLRERSQRVIFPLKTYLRAGHYKLRVNVDIGTGEIQEGTADVAMDAAPPASPAKPASK